MQDSDWQQFRDTPISPAKRRYWESTRTAIHHLIEKYIPNGAAVLDIGCGDGSYIRYLTDTGRWAIGIDPWPLSEDVRAQAEFLPFTDGSFDAALLVSVLQHVDDPASTLDEIRRVLKKGGFLITSAPVTLIPHDPTPLTHRYFNCHTFTNLLKISQFSIFDTKRVWRYSTLSSSIIAVGVKV